MAAKKSKKTKKWTEAANPRPADMPPRREELGKPHTREVPCTGDPAELEACALTLVGLIEEEAKVKEQKREANAKYREKLAGLDDRKTKISGALKSHRVLKPALVQEYLCADNMVEVVRVDTGEVVEKRVAESRDLQPDLFAEGTGTAGSDEGDDDDDE